MHRWHLVFTCLLMDGSLVGSVCRTVETAVLPSVAVRRTKRNAYFLYCIGSLV